MSEAATTYTAKLQEFFPPDDEDSEWLFRLMILRDDLQFELKGLPLEPHDGNDEVWRTGYFIRRISITLTEFRHIMVKHVTTLVKHPGNDRTLQLMKPLVARALKAIQKHYDVLDNLRDAVGGHMSPSNAQNPRAGQPGELRNIPDCVVRVLQTVDGQAVVRVLGEIADTSYREMSKLAILFPWPDATRSNDALHAKQGELQRAILESAGIALRIIDALLLRHWWKHGVAEPAEDYVFGILDPKTERLVPVHAAPPKSKPTNKKT